VGRIFTDGKLLTAWWKKNKYRIARSTQKKLKDDDQHEFLTNDLVGSTNAKNTFSTTVECSLKSYDPDVFYDFPTYSEKFNARSKLRANVYGARNMLFTTAPSGD